MATELSTNKKQAEAIREALRNLGNATRGYESVSSGIRSHKDGSTHYMKPEKATYAQGAEIFTAAAAEEREEVMVQRTFDYRPYDGAHALARALFQVYGHPGFGKAQYTMFGKIPPERKVVHTSHNTTVEVPWGELEIPDIPCTLHLTTEMHNEKGLLFKLVAICRKKVEQEVTGLFNLVQTVLEQESIYKGKAITGAETPEFLDLSKIRPDEVIFKHHIQEALEHEVWFVIENYKLMLADRQPTRWVSLLAGDYGTGKTLATMLTALRCQQNGITFIQCRPAQDNLEQVMQTAMLYSPAVVAYEDVETVAGSNASSATISRMLEAFDGIRSKGADVQVILTSNRAEEIDPGIIRAGRVHTYLHFEGLDAEALTKLITVKVGEARLENLDGDAVFAACEKYSPSFMDLVIQVARRYALSRNHKTLTAEHEVIDKNGVTVPGEKEFLDYRISTEDLVSAAQRLLPQWELMQEAKGRKAGQRPTMESILDNHITAIVRSEIQGTPLVQQNGGNQGLWLGTVKKTTAEAVLEKLG
jgi:hypothetical protein